MVAYLFLCAQCYGMTVYKLRKVALTGVLISSAVVMSGCVSAAEEQVSTGGTLAADVVAEQAKGWWVTNYPNNPNPTSLAQQLVAQKPPNGEYTITLVGQNIEYTVKLANSSACLVVTDPTLPQVQQGPCPR